MKTKLHLYEITEEFEALERLLEMDQGEVTEEYQELENKVVDLLKLKTDGYVSFVQSLNDKITIAKERTKSLDNFIKQKENQIERLDQYVFYAMDKLSVNEFKGELSVIKTRKPSKKIYIQDQRFVPIEFLEKEEVIKVKTNELKKALKSGVHFEGISLIDGKKSLSYKYQSQKD